MSSLASKINKQSEASATELVALNKE